MTIYTVPGCPACRKARTILKNEEISYTEENLFRLLLQKEKAEEVLKRCGYDGDIRVYQNNTSLLARPLIDAEEEMRSSLLEQIGECRRSCGNYRFCAGVRRQEANNG